MAWIREHREARNTMAKATDVRRLNVFERYLTLCVALCALAYLVRRCRTRSFHQPVVLQVGVSVHQRSVGSLTCNQLNGTMAIEP